MPYSGANDPSLPPNVKKMPAAKRAKWVNVWNSAFKNCRSPKVGAAGSVEKCETVAFEFANGAVKEFEMEEEEKTEEDKQTEMVVAVDAPPCLGGSVSFSEYDEYEAARDQEQHVRENTAIFRMIVDNIFSREDWNLTRKASAVVAASRELSARVQEPPSEGKSWKDRLKELLLPSGEGEKVTKRDDGKDFPASDYAYVPDAAKPSTWKLRLTKTPGGAPDAGIVGAAIAALGKGFRGQKVQIPAADLPAVKAKVRAAWRKANPDKKPEDMPSAIKEIAGVFTSFKDAQGVWRWIVINTNKFEDREGEIFSENSHKEYISSVERTGDWPELWFWHTPGTRIGQASMVDYVDGFVVHTGNYDEGFDDVAERLQRMQSQLGVSHGYEYPEGDEKDGVYDHYKTFELTLCPAARAANIWGTGFGTFQKEVTMGFSPEKRDFFVETLGEERVAALEEKLPALAKELEKSGVSFKDLVEGLVEESEDEEESAAGEVEGTPVVKEAETEEETPTVEERLTALETEQGKVLTAIGELTSSVKAATETVGERIEREVKEALSGEKPPKINGDRPSESEKTEITEEEAEEIAVGFSEATPKDSPARTLVEDLLNRGSAVAGS